MTHDQTDPPIDVENGDDDGFVSPRSGSFRIIDTHLPEAGKDFPRSRAELSEMFPTEQSCQRYLERLRWPRGFACGECGDRTDPWRSGTGLLACTHCRTLVAVTHGSLFHGAAIPLTRWFRAMWDLTDREAGTSAAEIGATLQARDPAVAERCLETLRTAMRRPTRRRLRGLVTVAKTMVEVSQRGALGRPSMHRAQVLVAVEHSHGEGGQVRMGHLRHVGSCEAVECIRRHVEPGTEVRTPPWVGYTPLRQAGYRHQPITVPNGALPLMPEVEHVGALLRLWLWSTADVTAATLPGLLDEFTFRFNRRWYPRGLLFYRLMILAALFDTADDELLGDVAVG